MYTLGVKSKQRLKGIHPDLIKVVERAIEITTVDFTVLEGLRTPERQKKLKEAGASQTLNSRHITGHAVDLGAFVDGQVDWSWPLYHEIAKAMKSAAAELSIPIEWGCDWSRLKDGPHLQLPRKEYP
jgi:peptidoglycan L-alanyl-D-glutamate endopeptidase CwlK